MPKLLVMAGGTGGHIYPGIAVAEALRQQGWQIAWMGNEDRMEGRIVPPRGYEMVWVQFGAVRGKGLLRFLMLPFNLLRAFHQSWQALRRVQPDVVLGMGGYVSFPGGMMAALIGIPLVLHEQNSKAGLANRVLAGVADRVLSGFPDVLRKAEWIGNPVRSEIAAVPAPEVRTAGRTGLLRILVVGGSLGAQALNEVVPQALALMSPSERPTVTHQSGEAQLPFLMKAYQRAGVQGELVSFIDNMAERYAQADLVICRAGALTVAELATIGAASVLVPYPHAVDDHQTGNARFLSDRGAAILLPQHELSPARLARLFGELDRGRLLQMARTARSLARPFAADAVAGVCVEVARQ